MAHLTVSQRYTIETLFKAGHTRTAIAKLIGKDKSLVSRELQRNSDGRSGVYRSELAHRKYQK